MQKSSVKNRKMNLTAADSSNIASDDRLAFLERLNIVSLTLSDNLTPEISTLVCVAIT